MGPNVMLVVLDAARRDALEPYGAPAGSSPAIAELAERGAALERMFATACWTAPSHASMLTGLLPGAVGIGTTPGTTPHKCADALEVHMDRLLPEVLRSHGFATAAISANLWLSETSGFARGFDEFISVDSGRQAQLHGESRRARMRWLLEGVRARVDDGAAEAEQALRAWLGRRPDRPFFCFVNLIECHSPYLPPRPYDDLPARDRLRAAEDARRYLTLGSIWRACAGELDVPEESLERMRHLYRRSVRYADDWVARALEALDGHGILDETLVIVTSDHGENLGEAGLMGHALSLDNRLLHVPFASAGPGAPDDEQVHSLAEVPRLVAEALEVEDHPWPADALPVGAAVAQFYPPATRGDPRLAQAVDELELGAQAVERLTTPFRCATDGRYKLVERDGMSFLHDLRADPLEVSPVPVEQAGAAASHDSLARLTEALRHPAAAPTAGTPAEAVDEPRQPSPEELREIEARMRLLGYM